MVDFFRSYLLSTLGIVLLMILSLIIAAILMKYVGRYLLYQMNVKTSAIMQAQVVGLLLFAFLFSAIAIISWQLLPWMNSASHGIETVLLRGTPEATIRQYYSAINQGIPENNFWRAYELCSKQQQVQRHYDHFRDTFKGIKQIHVKKLKLIERTANSAQILAEIIATVEADGMIKEQSEQIEYWLTLEEGWWRVESFADSKL